MLKNQWGEFKAHGKCFEITNPSTPLGWNNYISSADGKFYAEISQRGLGPVYYNYEANLVSRGRNYCIKDSVGAIWSLNGGVSRDKPNSFSCKQLPGRSVFEVSNNGVTSTLAIALNPYKYEEINRLELKNDTNVVRKIELTSYVLVELEGSDNTQQLEQTMFYEKSHALLFQRKHARTANNKYAAYYVADIRPDSYCGSYHDFLGGDCCIEDAVAWQNDKLPEIHAYSTKPIMALRFNIILRPNEIRTINFCFGIADDYADASAGADNFLEQGYAEKAMLNNEELYSEVLAKGWIATPDSNLNIMLNYWSRIQLFHQNISARKGDCHNWRNNLQDAMGWLLFDPSWARKRIRQMCELAHADGFMPRSSPKGNFVSEKHRHSLTQKHTDIATWAALCAARYANETGDIDFFREKVACENGGENTTVAECLVNGLSWLINHRGQHGMVLFLDGDWSDPLEAAGKRGIGESPWTSVALINSINNFSPILHCLKMDKSADKLAVAKKELIAAVNEHAWDKNWYIRGITDDGIRFCTKSDPDANVSLMMQAWAIISGAVPTERFDSVINALDKFCKTDLGPILYGPPFLTERPEIGRESAKRPGTGENGSCYTHGAMMLAWAESKIGRQDEALKIIQQVVPLAQTDVYAVRMGSPLWWSNYYQSLYGGVPGRSSNIISSGAPAWFFMNIYEGLLGITPTLEGLFINPQIPSLWNKIKVVRKWRGAIYDFEFHRNPDTDSRCKVILDGMELLNKTIPVACDNKKHSVEVYFQ